MTSKLKSIINMMPVIILSAGIFISCQDSSRQDGTDGKTAGEETSPTTGEDLAVSDNFIITYNLSGKMEGTMKMYRKGNNLKQEMNTEIMGKESSNQVFIDGENAYVVTDIGDNKLGTKFNLKDYNKQKQTGETITNPEEFEEFLKTKNKVGTETILGKETDIYDLGNNTKLSVYGNMYVLKISSPEFQAVATDIEINPSFAPDEFSVPQDVDFKSIDQGMKELKNLKNIDSLMEKLKRE